MEGYVRALKECLSNPLSVITNGSLWILFLIIEVAVIFLVLLIYKRYGSFIRIEKKELAVVIGIVIGYVVHFLIVILVTGTIYSGHIIP